MGVREPLDFICGWSRRNEGRARSRDLNLGVCFSSGIKVSLKQEFRGLIPHDLARGPL